MDRTFRKILKRIAPDGMSPEEYAVRCSVNGVSASPDDPAFVEWLVGEALSDDDELRCEVGELIAAEVEKGALLDFKRLSGEADERMAAVVSGCVMCRNGAFRDRLFEAVLRTAPRSSASWKAAFRLNKAFGFTSACYFRDGRGNPSDGICRA